MRIGMVSGEYPPMEGGVGDFTHQLGEAFLTQGHEVHILTTCFDRTQKKREDGLTVHRCIQNWGWSAHSQITRWIRDISPDIVNIQYQAAAFNMRGGINLFPRWQQRYINCPLVTTYHDLLPPYLFPKAGPMRQWTVWQLAQYSNGIIVTNGGDYKGLTRAVPREDLPPIRMVPIGSNIAPNPPEGYNKTTWRISHNFTKDDIVIGFFGFINRSKGIETLLQAVMRLKNEGHRVHLLLIGGRTGTSDVTNAAYADEIDALIEDLAIGDRVHRTGFADPSEVSAALLSVDMCVLPYRDGASLRRGTLHAALAHGTAIITTTPQAPTPQLKDGENVILIPAQDTDALTQAICALWADPTQRKHLKKCAQALAQEFSWERIAAHTLEFFRTLAKQHRLAQT